MKIHIHCVSKRPADWVSTAASTYLKRLKGQLDVRIVEVSPAGGKLSASVRREKEAAALHRLRPDPAYAIALDERGDSWSTLELAAQIDDWRQQHANVVFIIGGADGLDRSVREGADRNWSLSRLTLPHQLVRVVLVEQIYRAWSALHNHPYHRA